MNLREGEQFLRCLVTPHLQAPFHIYNHIPFPYDFPSLIIHYPGNRNKHVRGLDYLVTLNGNNITHNNIAARFYDLARQIHPNTLVNFILNIYIHGQEVQINHLPNVNIEIGGLNLSWIQFKELIFFVVIQENFNFPQPRYWGVKMPFIRFIEAVFSFNHPNQLDLFTLNNRINNGNRNLIEDMPDEYMNAIEYILNN